MRPDRILDHRYNRLCQRHPFSNQIDTVFSESDTGYIQIVNTGEATFSSVVGTIALSVGADDLSLVSDPFLLAPAAKISIAMPHDTPDVSGFNGPAFRCRQRLRP